MADTKPWVSSTGFRTAVQAWHPVHGLSLYRPRCDVHGIPDCSPLLNGCSRVVRAVAAHDRAPNDSETGADRG